MLESTLRSTLYHVYNHRYERSCKKVFDLDFQGHAIKIEFFIITVGFLDPENIPMRNTFEKFGREDQNPGGGTHPPPWAPKVDFYLGHLRVKIKDRPSIHDAVSSRTTRWKGDLIITINTTAIQGLWIVYFRTSRSLRAPPCSKILNPFN